MIISSKSSSLHKQELFSRQDSETIVSLTRWNASITFVLKGIPSLVLLTHVSDVMKPDSFATLRQVFTTSQSQRWCHEADNNVVLRTQSQIVGSTLYRQKNDILQFSLELGIHTWTTETKEIWQTPCLLIVYSARIISDALHNLETSQICLLSPLKTLF